MQKTDSAEHTLMVNLLWLKAYHAYSPLSEIGGARQSTNQLRSRDVMSIVVWLAINVFTA